MLSFVQLQKALVSEGYYGYPDGAFGNSPEKKQEQPSSIIEKPAPSPIVLEKTTSSSKPSKCNDFSLSKDTRSDDSISNADKLFFDFIMDLAKAFALGLSYIVLMALTILVPLGARLWQSIFWSNNLKISNLKWYQVKSICLFGIGIVLGSGIREMNSFLPHYKSANNLIQNHNNSLASSAAHNLAISNEFFHQFGDFIVQSQSNTGHSASSFIVFGQLDNESFQSLSSVW